MAIFNFGIYSNHWGNKYYRIKIFQEIGGKINT